MTQLEYETSKSQSQSNIWQTTQLSQLLSARLPKRETRVQIIPGAHGFAFYIEKGSNFRITDLHGAQVVDLMAWCAPFSPSTTCEHFSASYTRYNLSGAAPPAVGEHLYSNHDRAMFEVVGDTVKVHDMQFMACNPGFYDRLGKPGHRSCARNIAEAMTGFLKESEIKGHDDFTWPQVHDPFNCFQNTPYYTIKGGINTSRRGDYIEFEAKMNAVVALSACPYEEQGFNGGKSTDVAVTWETTS